MNKPITYISLFSGIEAASVAWEPLGWKPLCFCEIDEFPSAVLAEHYPDVPNLGDITKVDWSQIVERYGRPDVVVGGSPCQSFSIAGGRESLHGESRLMFEYIRAVADIEPTFFIWENVPGCLSTKDNAFGQLLGEMERIGYRDLAWSILDAQFFGVAQRRKRVFLVGCRGGGYRSAAVLFDAESLRGNPQKESEKRKELAVLSGKGPTEGGEGSGITAFKYIAGAAARTMPTYSDGTCNTLTADWHSPAIAIDSGKMSDSDDEGDNCLTPWDVQSKRVFSQDGVAPTLSSGTSEGMNIQPCVAQPVAFAQNQHNRVRLINGDGAITGSLTSQPGMQGQTFVAQPTVMASGHSHAEIGVGGGCHRL